MERDFKGMWIPKDIWLTEELSWIEKVLLAEIDSLTKLGECYASNGYFAEFLSLSKDRVSKLISSLSKKGYIEVYLAYKEGCKEIEKRTITTIGYRRKQLDPIVESNYTPIGENNQDNNTLINNTFNNKKKKKEKKKAEEQIKLTDIDKLVISYTINEELRTTIYDFVKMRKAIKKVMTDKALELMLKKLDKLGSNDTEKIAILNQSIMNSWQGIFELKDKKVNNNVPRGDTSKFSGFKAKPSTVKLTDEERRRAEKELI